MTEIEMLALILSLIFNGVMALIAIMAERRARKIEERLYYYKELEMYADIGYGYGAERGWNPWDVHDDVEYTKWQIRFNSYNGRVHNAIQNDYSFLVDKNIIRPSSDEDIKNEYRAKKKKIIEFARNQVKEIGSQLRTK